MAREVHMWNGVAGPVAGAENCFTTGLFDCVALALRGETEAGDAGYYFGHLTSHQYQKMTDSEGNGVKALRQFFATYRSNVQMKAAVNFQPEVDWSAEFEKMRPTSIQDLVAGLLRTVAGGSGAYTPSKMKYLAVAYGGATVTLDVSTFQLYAAHPDHCALLNNIHQSGAYKDYCNWSYPEILAAKRERDAEREAQRAAKKSFCTIL